MKHKTDLYTYSDSWENSLHSKTLWKTIKRTYIFKSSALLVALPIDILIIAFIMLSGRRFNLFFATEKWPLLTETASVNTSTASISPPTFLINQFKSKAKYLPASIFYILAALGLALPNSLRSHWSSVAVFLTANILKRLVKNSATIVVHSDALPFGRVLVMAANRIFVKTVCIQHGNFREYNVIGEQDGFLCTHNIVRSLEDGRIICKSNSQTIVHIIPDFFRIKLTEHPKKNSKPRVLLLGEGYHIIDPKFNKAYLDYLVAIQSELIKCGVDVVFRPHPSERNMRWRNQFKKIDLAPLESSLASANAVVGYSSTLLQESAEIGIPAFYVEPCNGKRKIDSRNGVTIKKLIRNDVLVSDANMHNSNSREMLTGLNDTQVTLDVVTLLLS